LDKPSVTINGVEYVAKLNNVMYQVSNHWQDLHDDDKTCMQSSYWELILENGQ
jgi:hypothetical protein